MNLGLNQRDLGDLMTLRLTYRAVLSGHASPA
jgi:hypothetical protein